MPLSRSGPCAAVLLLAGCAHGVIALSTAPPSSTTPPAPIEITARGEGVRSPLPMRGSCLVFAALEESLAHAVASEALPWAEAHRRERPDGWQLIVDLWRASAVARGGTVTVVLGVRATLRTRAGNRYLAQTQAHCKQTALSEPTDQVRVTKAKAEAQALSLLAKAHADEKRAEAVTLTPLMVQMHAYDSLAKLGGTGTQIMLGDWSRVPSFLFPGIPGLSLGASRHAAAAP
jgi:hypothetical protein